MELDNPSYFSVAGEIKRSNFSRSISSNSNDSKEEMLLIMGEPRPCDIAPELALNHRTRIDNDVLYNALPTSEDNDEVFIAEDTARYYNYSVKRRHSIGTFIARERSSSLASSSRSFKEDFPQAIVHATSDGDSVGPADNHSLRHASYPRKRCPQCTRGSTRKNSDMDDILIVSLKASDASTLWVDYFTNYFEQISKQAERKPFKIEHLCVEDILTEPKDSPKLEKAATVKLQLVILCPGMLEFVSEYPEQCQILNKTMSPDRTLALLLGVSDDDVTEVHRKVLSTYFQWQRLSVGQDQDETFTKEFLGLAMTILSRSWKKQQEKSPFSVFPKKIRQGQSTFFVMLTNPLQKEDVLKVSIEGSSRETYEVKSVKRRNPYTIKISVPDVLTEVTAIVNVLVEKNGSVLGSRPIKCESRLRELEQILRFTNNPVEFMCQTLGFSPSSKEHLDNWLLQGFQRNLPTHFNLLANHVCPFGAAMPVRRQSHEEYPTLLHFAARFGFEKLALQLLDCPGADLAYEIRNVHDMTPAEIAEGHDHAELAATLREFMSMNEFTSAYSKLKEISMQSSKLNIGEDSYLTPKNIEDLYKICPAPRPVLQEASRLPLPVTTPLSDCSTPPGYMAMKTPVKIIVEDGETQKKNTSKTENIDSPQTPKTKPEFVEDKVQKELLEILNDFKNNVHSISQAEKFVEEWKNRNDVQKSFKERQEQLEEMRSRFVKIQQEMKTAMKKPTPFERFKKLFGRSKSVNEEKNEITSPISPSIVAISHRPISSLSTSSSESSGRMSTISGCSLGDSGTHSDNEEKKNLLSHSEDMKYMMELKNLLDLNYTPVPIPKPVTNFRQTFETIEEKPMRPDTLAIAEEFYIQFPPSGRPVTQNKTPNQEYMNVSIEENKETGGNHEYMNFKVVR